ncbi:SapC protein [Rhodothalassium salexigens DSM 2132]|uniref:SapC protein n=1 Tax=Rhodothalassium salexigens DSM 2132 TaxID=1188247 RepID=A0A4R2PHA9_RHOSA|nr:SapC family protein [Rhodothalassium salexigens]MBB4211864.1 hypothetical protein [Rhodothalassium salexigens DSM 2132]MBK1638906.1 hypothetical protein [Rhodothalassium salexigens DSM 2132]TCP33551.1 SapC protein [Rhodothalassium salexigens DSM 2132]
MNDAAGQGAQDDAPQLPLFYQQPEILRRDLHANLGLVKQADYSFAREANAVPLTVSEFAMAGLNYPIIFVGEGQKTPVAVMSYERGRNFFVDENGRWEATAYIPAYVRRYPFVFMRDDQNERFALCIDRASSLIAETEQDVQPFFAEGEQTDLIKNALDFCTAYQQEAQATEQFIGLMTKHDLIVERAANLTLKDGQTSTINNIGVVDEEKLNALSDEAFLELRTTGALGAIYCHLMAQKAWQPLILRG